MSVCLCVCATQPHGTCSEDDLSALIFVCMRIMPTSPSDDLLVRSPKLRLHALSASLALGCASLLPPDGGR
eukprot:1000113-Prymnesium_polylepis.1